MIHPFLLFPIMMPFSDISNGGTIRDILYGMSWLQSGFAGGRQNGSGGSRISQWGGIDLIGMQTPKVVI